ncbi:hypothetical protein BJF92_00745 [Rhizobium rhizosphaerae]|uniref:Uncharacterized protein n=1 Tax=Xaviernesmea rhizosphaerae TaxID=1672749 RepID=A0A1Q9AEI5_9HYPH|nr:hypothetical protein [Xaviernesmea rhizosphaerae]OLP53329.1 hypothetical protein BJF92_00745 [Xaviernesmea rhizosphaerae]OQP84961.1 hypothetical protein BTR14_17860 [Xaviernesmea rhizosphaerae]
MSETRKKIYEALIDGATDGLSGQQLYDHVRKRVPKTTSKKLVRAALLALTDPDVNDKHVLDVIYALAIRHRLDTLQAQDGDQDDEPVATVPVLKKSKSELRGGVSGGGLEAGRRDDAG